MRVLLVGDIHLSDRPPSIRTEAYADQIFAKLEYTVGLREELKADAVVWAGDVFHIKAPSRTSHYLVQRTATLGKSYGVPWLIVPGNHDMQHDRLESLDRQPLGVLYRAGAIPLIGEQEVAGETLYGVPYLQQWSDLRIALRGWREGSARLLVTHAPIFPPGETVPYEFIDAEDWGRQMERPGHVYYGHIHDLHGAYETENATFCNQGALSRGSLHESTLRRKPAVTLVETDEDGAIAFTRYEVPHLPAEEVFTLAEHRDDEARQERLDEFLSSVEGTTLRGLSVEAVLEHVKTMDLDEATLREVVECIEEAASK